MSKITSEPSVVHVSEEVFLKLQEDLRRLDAEIEEAKKASRATPMLRGKLEKLKIVRALERERSDLQRRLFRAQDEAEI